jgi:hypothetical protein
MVTKLVYNLVTGFLSFLLGLLPTFAPPTWLHDLGSYAADGVAFANGFHAWVPLTAMRNVFGTLLTIGGVVLAVRAVRIGISLFTGGGGSAA